MNIVSQGLAPSAATKTIHGSTALDKSRGVGYRQIVGIILASFKNYQPDQLTELSWQEDHN